MKQLRETRYTNQQTGEIVTKKSYVDMLFDDEEGFLFSVQKDCTRMFADIPLPEEFSDIEVGRLHRLMSYIAKKEQFLVYKVGRAFKPMDDEKTAELLNVPVRSARELLNKCERLGVIKKLSWDDDAWYMFNPMYGMRSKRLTLTMYIVFQEELKGVLPPWVVRKFAEQAEEIKPKIKILN